jgi:hypothetical protein
MESEMPRRKRFYDEKCHDLAMYFLDNDVHKVFTEEEISELAEDLQITCENFYKFRGKDKKNEKESD